MKKIIDKIKIKLGTVSMALANVEKNAFSQSGDQLESDTVQTQRHTQGQVMDSLINGEITQEVMDLRWRTYKVIKASEGVKVDINGFNKDGSYKLGEARKTNTTRLKKVKIDPTDTYNLEMVIDNTEIDLSGSEALESSNLELLPVPVLNYDENGDVVSATHGEIGSVEFLSENKGILPIQIERDVTPIYRLERYTKKMNVRSISKTKKLLELCVSIYPDIYNVNSKPFLKQIKKLIENPTTNDILEIKSINFITNKDMGVEDFLEYEYEIESFDKITEFNGHYLIKFIANVKKDGLDIFESHRVESLDEKYKNNVRKK